MNELKNIILNFLKYIAVSIIYILCFFLLILNIVFIYGISTGQLNLKSLLVPVLDIALIFCYFLFKENIISFLKGKNTTSVNKSTMIAIIGLIAGFVEGYIPIICWGFLVANLVALIFYKEGLPKKFIAFSLVGFFIGYFLSWIVIFANA